MVKKYAEGMRNGTYRVGGKLYTPASDREYWEGLSKSNCENIVKMAEENLNYDWPSLLATQFMQFERTGNRVAWETPYFKRHQILTTFVLAECIEYKGRFLDDIINGLVLICEETYWGLSAHRHGDCTGIPQNVDPYLDIFGSDRGELLALTVYLLEDVLDKTVIERVKAEVKLRMMDAFLKHNDFWWQAIPRFEGDKRLVNNWNAWICSNLITTYALLSPDEEYMREGLAKVLEIFDIFVKGAIPEDGGCDEGAGYWCGAWVESVIDKFCKFTKGDIDLSGEPLFKKYGDFFGAMVISPYYVVNFSDSIHLTTLGSAVFSYGKITDNPALCNVSSKNFINRAKGVVAKNYRLSFWLKALELVPEMLNFDTDKELPDCNYFDRIQVLSVWQDRKNSTGLFLAAKGGHNDESHNHNDVGGITVYANATPLLIDPGKGTYTKDHFNQNRYKIWHNTSNWHNLPEINGLGECQGRHFAAKNVLLTEGNITQFDVDLEGTYQDTACLESYHRNTSFDKVNGIITVTDSFVFNKDDNVVTENLIFPTKPEIDGNSVIVTTENGTKGKIEWNVTGEVSLDFMDVTDDELLVKQWGDGVYRIRVTCNCEREFVFSYSIRIVE